MSNNVIVISTIILFAYEVSLMILFNNTKKNLFLYTIVPVIIYLIIVTFSISIHVADIGIVYRYDY